MAGARKDILAGSAYVRLWVDNSAFVKGLQNARARLHSMGAAIMSVGAKTTAVGSAIVGAFAAAGNHFASTGDKLDKMAARTGIAEDKLSALGFAAQQSGATMDDVGQAVQRMNRRLGRITAGEGTSSQVKAMEELGLSLSDIQSMNPEQRFMALADAMANYGDDAAAAGLAQRAFGTGVDKLLPLFADGSAGIRELMDEAKELGVVMSTEDADAAAALTDAMGRVKSTLSAVVQQIGAAVAPVMEEMANKLAGVTSKVIAWVKENKNLVVMAAKVGVAIMAAGAAITGIGAVIFGVGTAFGVLASAASLAAGAIGFILSPVGLVTAALAGGVYAFINYSETGRRMMDALRDKVSSALTSLRETFGAAFAGIRDAIQAGDWAMAGKIAMTALQVVIAQGAEAVSSIIRNTLGDAFGSISEMLLSGDFAGAWNSIVLGMSKIWSDFTSGIVTAMSDAAKDAVTLWKGAVDGIVNYILEQSQKSKALSDVFQVGGSLATGGAEEAIGPSIYDETQRNEKLDKEMRAASRRSTLEAIGDVEAEINTAVAKGDEEGVARLREQLEMLRDTLRQLEQSGPVDIFQQIKTGSYEDEATKATAERLTKRLNEMQAAAKADATSAGEAFDESIQAGTGVASERVAMLRKELEDLRAEAKKMVDESKKEGQSSYGVLAAPGGPGGDGGTDGGTGRASAATFSARAALAMSQGSGESPTVKATEGVKKAIVKSETVLADLLTQVNINIKNQSLHHP